MSASASSQAPPRVQLYRHAIESVLAFLPLSGLHSALAINRDWSGAVMSMRSIRVKMSKPPASLDPIARSSLGRHIMCFGSHAATMQLTVQSLLILVQRMAHIKELYCTLKLGPSDLDTIGDALHFPPRLSTLFCIVQTSEVHPAQSISLVNAAIVAVSRLPLLDNVGLEFPRFSEEVNFAPLQAHATLKCFGFDWSDYSHRVSDAQADVIRSFQVIEKLELPDMKAAFLMKLLLKDPFPRRPHLLKTGFLADLDEESASLLKNFPSLEEIRTTIRTKDLDFLQPWPRLSIVTLGVRFAPQGIESSILTSLPRYIPHLTALNIGSGSFTADQLAVLKFGLPQMRELRLREMQMLKSLQFLAVPSLITTLEALDLVQLQLPPEEEVHIRPLRRLKRIALDHAFSQRLSDEVHATYANLPQLCCRI
jgi:hypothetical protein